MVTWTWRRGQQITTTAMCLSTTTTYKETLWKKMDDIKGKTLNETTTTPGPVYKYTQAPSTDATDTTNTAARVTRCTHSHDVAISKHLIFTPLRPDKEMSYKELVTRLRVGHYQILQPRSWPMQSL